MLIVIDKFRKRVGTFAIVVLLIAGMVSGFNSFARAAEGQLNFILVAVDVAPDTDGVKPILILSGHGTFTSGSVNGGGRYTYADGATEIPKTILSTGTWKATEVLRWTPSAGGATYGQVRPGTVDLRVDLVPEQGPVIKGATLRINCNVGLAGIRTKIQILERPWPKGSGSLFQPQQPLVLRVPSGRLYQRIRSLGSPKSRARTTISKRL